MQIRKTLILLLQAILLLTGLAVLYMMIRLPQTEGRATDLSTLEIYSDPFILYGYISSIPFFIALYNGIRLLGLIAQSKWHSTAAANTLKRIRYCVLLSVLLIAGAAVYIQFTHEKEDDPVGFLVVCMVVILMGLAVAFVAHKYENKIKHSTVNKDHPEHKHQQQ